MKTYHASLDEVSKKRYYEKLMHQGEDLPDPLDETLRQQIFKLNNYKAWPNISFGDVYMYLVETECVYTKEKFKNYKALEAYNYFLSGKVHNILCYQCKTLKVCVMSCEVQASQTMSKFHYPWIVASSDGFIFSGHCTCMAGKINQRLLFLTALSDSEQTDSAEEGEDSENTNFIQKVREVDSALPKSLSNEERFKMLVKKLCLPLNIINKVEQETQTQRHSELWFLHRKGRLTASLFGKVLRCKSGQKGIVAKVMQCERKIMTENMRWGIENEPEARIKFLTIMKELHVNLSVSQVGLKIHEEYPFLGASPDGVVQCDCCETALLEIKCPSRGKDRSIQDLLELRNFYLDPNKNLLDSHIYYDQIQGQMDVWNISKCYFVTYTNADINIQLIEYDANYWDFQRPILINFYKKFVLPEILK